jgi:uncharacterized protein DUF3237
MPGGDWMSVGDDGYNRPDVRMQFQTDDGAIVLLHYTGLVERSLMFRAAAESGNETSFADNICACPCVRDRGAGVSLAE